MQGSATSSDRSIVAFGSSRCEPGSPQWHQAYAVGEAIGRRGLKLVSGGYDGSMGAASEGARTAGASVLGMTTDIFTGRKANGHLTEEIRHATYSVRLAALMEAGDGFVVLPGGLGTLSELTTAWCLATIGQLAGPLWVFKEPWGALADMASRLGEVADEHHQHLHWVESPDDLAVSLDRWLASGSAR